MAKPPMVPRTFRAPLQLWEDGHAAADLNGEDLSEVIRRKIREYIAETQEKHS